MLDLLVRSWGAVILIFVKITGSQAADLHFHCFAPSNSSWSCQPGSLGRLQGVKSVLDKRGTILFRDAPVRVCRREPLLRVLEGHLGLFCTCKMVLQAWSNRLSFNTRTSGKLQIACMLAATREDCTNAVWLENLTFRPDRPRSCF